MRRLMLLLLAVFAVFGAAAAPAVTRSGGTAAVHHAMPGGCHHEGQAAGHVCLGCAVAPDAVAAPADARRPGLSPRPVLADALVGRPLRFEPPPPRIPA